MLLAQLFRQSYLYILLIIFFSCGGEDPVFPSNDDEPRITITNPTDGDTFSTSSITIEWIRENENARIFDYKLEYVDSPITTDWIDPHIWTEWDTTSATSIDFSHLDEGEYIFYINGRYDLDNVGAEHTISFMVDAITDPALRIYPMHQQVAINESFYIFVYAETMENLVGSEIDLEYDITKLEYESSSSGCDIDSNYLEDNNNGFITKLYCDLIGNYITTEPLFQLKFIKKDNANTDINIMPSSRVGDDTGNYYDVDILMSGTIVTP